MADGKPRFQISLQTMFLLVLAFAIGFTARNLASGLHPFAMRLVLPSSTTPIVIGDELIVESLTDSSIDRRVVVLSDGTIKLPSAGTIKVAGQDVAAIEKTLTTAYASYYKNPVIQVYRADASQSIRSK
jgi:protein involved in polysaccharide export with SLBB domain